MNTAYADQNRAVHLARRDAFFERAVDLLYGPLTQADTMERIKGVQTVLYLLRKAQKHGYLAAHAAHASEKERDFLHFLKLIAQNVQSAHSMMLNQVHLEEDESFLCQFLGTDQQQCAAPAIAYGRRAEDILRGLWHVFRLALTPYRALQEENIALFSDDERARYKRALQSAHEELSAILRQQSSQIANGQPTLVEN